MHRRDLEQHVGQVEGLAQHLDDGDVAERIVYRHFGTKEGLVVHDEADDAFIGDVVRRARRVGALAAVDEALDALPGDAWSGPAAPVADRLRKLRLLRGTPALRTVFAQATASPTCALSSPTAWPRCGPPRPATRRDEGDGRGHRRLTRPGRAGDVPPPGSGDGGAAAGAGPMSGDDAGHEAGRVPTDQP